MLLYNPREPARALQRARHAQVPAHLQADPRQLPLLRHGPHLLLDRRRHASAGTTPSAAAARKALVAERWGAKSYQEHRNDWTQNGHDGFLVEPGKYGLGRRDLAANVNWFSKVAVDDDGSMALRPGDARPAPRSSCASRWTRWCCSIPARTRSIRRRLSAQADRLSPRHRAQPVADDDFCRNFRRRTAAASRTTASTT